jgi:hypothetical protein
MTSQQYVPSPNVPPGEQRGDRHEYSAAVLYHHIGTQTSRSLVDPVASSIPSRAFEDDFKITTQEERRRSSLTQCSLDEKLETLEEQDDLLDKSLLDLERAVAMLDLDPDNQMKYQERTLSRVSMYSNSSGSIYSRDGAEDLIAGLDTDTQNPAMNAVWLHLAESTTLPDSGDINENASELVSWYTAL